MNETAETLTGKFEDQALAAAQMAEKIFRYLPGYANEEATLGYLFESLQALQVPNVHSNAFRYLVRQKFWDLIHTDPIPF